MAEKKISKSKSAAKPYPEAAHQPAGKVAEGVATYAAYVTPMPRTPARTIAGLAADDEVWTFVKANDLLPHLGTAIDLAKKSFVNMREARLSFDPDPELFDFNSVTIRVKAAGTPEELFEQYKKYVSLFVDAVPSEYRRQISMLVGVA